MSWSAIPSIIKDLIDWIKGKKKERAKDRAKEASKAVLSGNELKFRWILRRLRGKRGK